MRISEMRYEEGKDGFNGEVLAHLVMQASSLFEIDRCKARECIERAAELLRDKEPNEYPSRGGLSGSQMKRVSGYVEANLAAKILIADLADLAHFSLGHFFRAFRASFGMSPQAYIMRERIRRAAALISQSDEPLAKIAVDCGLCDQSHLTRVFHRIVGVTPHVWRRHHMGRGRATLPQLGVLSPPPQSASIRNQPPPRYMERQEPGKLFA
jgi:AraC family transcriptional regulator